MKRESDESWLEIFQGLWWVFFHPEKHIGKTSLSVIFNFCFVLLLLLFTLQEKSSTMSLPTERQETAIFLSY